MIRAAGEKDVASLKENIRRSELIKLFNWQKNVVSESGTSHTRHTSVMSIILEVILAYTGTMALALIHPQTSSRSAQLVQQLF